MFELFTRKSVSLLLIVCFYSCVNHAIALPFAQSSCSIQQVLSDTQRTERAVKLKGEVKFSDKVSILKQQLEVALPSGKSEFKLNCNLNSDMVITFSDEELLTISWRQLEQTRPALSSTKPAFLVKSGTTEAFLRFSNHANYTAQVNLHSFDSFIENSQKNNLIMGMFFGLCLTLIFYILIIGRSLNDSTFKLYSFYIASSMIFFLLQEGQLKLFLPSDSFVIGHQMYLLMAGMTVMSATFFIINVTDIATYWDKLTTFVIQPFAIGIFAISIGIMLLEHNQLSNVLGRVMAISTLLLMALLIGLVVNQTIKGVPSTGLVLFALCIMFFAVLFRTLLGDINPFVQRYGLIFAFAIESFILAVVVAQRIKRIDQQKQQAELDAHHDHLCGILNRRGWIKKANTILQMHQKQGGFLCLLYIDLDGFKKINDDLGHDAGDEVLVVIAKILHSNLKEVDAVGRIGGDEFVVLGHFLHKAESEQMQDRVRQRLKDLDITIDDALFYVSASVGCVTFDSPPPNVESMLKQADRLMYQEKHGNRKIIAAY